MKLYGSIENRLEENRQFCDEIKVGTGITEYFYTDRMAYEVVEVKDQKHISIREYKHVKADDRQYSNNWELISDPTKPVIELVKRGKYWYTFTTATIEDLNKMECYKGENGRYIVNDDNFNYVMWFVRNFDEEQIRKHGKQTKYFKRNISVGVASYYFDYEF